MDMGVNNTKIFIDPEFRNGKSTKKKTPRIRQNNVGLMRGMKLKSKR